jgi:uncharacterized membrane protein SpoIIM required for sporulation
MREVAFVRKHREKWERFERLLREENPDPDDLADLYVQVTDDLAYARTHYPDGKAVRYLNELATEVHQALYRNRTEDRSRMWRFWTEEVPRTVWTARRELLVSFAVFVLAIGIGTLSAAYDDGFVRLILGDGYVNQTLSNIEKGDPMAVYKKMHEVDMFLGIAFNNVKVSFYAFAMGLLASVGTGYVLFQNGVMLGAFHYLFYEQGLLAESLLVVYIHGTLEISAIIVAGAAGFVLGNGLLFPGTYTRRESFTRGARRGAKIVVGLVPLFLIAAFLEGFVTRFTDMPVVLSLFIIGGSLAFVLWYFVAYPVHLHR